MNWSIIVVVATSLSISTNLKWMLL